MAERCWQLTSRLCSRCPLIVITLYVSTRGLDHLPIRIGRFALTATLFLWLYRGSNVARAICIVLFGITGVLATPALFEDIDLIVRGYMGSMAVAHLSFAVVLMASPSVSSFLEYQRNAQQPKRWIVTQRVGEVFLWPKYTILKPLDRLTLALPAAMLGPDETVSTIINCDDGAEITTPESEGKIYIRLDAGMAIWMRRSSQAMVLPWVDGESEAKRMEFSALPRGDA